MRKTLQSFLLGGVSALALLTASESFAATFEFTFTGAVETGTITQSGTYRLTLGGATGGRYLYNGGVPGPYTGGFGAALGGTLYLAAGTSFSVLVGGNGETVNEERGGGGGGLSYFNIGMDSTIEAIAGGGGGGGYYGDGGPGLAGTAGGNAEDAAASYSPGYTSPSGVYLPPFTTVGGYGGTGGSGGQVSFEDNAGGGAGILSNGGEELVSSGDSVDDIPSNSGGKTGPSWAGGANISGSRADGGFGGGGAGGLYGGGGGGGFSGGGGGYAYGGGGGGSYLAALLSDQSLTTGGATSGAYVNLDLVAPAVIPTPGALGLMATSMLAMGAVARRRKRRAD